MDFFNHHPLFTAELNLLKLNELTLLHIYRSNRAPWQRPFPSPSQTLSPWVAAASAVPNEGSPPTSEPHPNMNGSHPIKERFKVESTNLLQLGSHWHVPVNLCTTFAASIFTSWLRCDGTKHPKGQKESLVWWKTQRFVCHPYLISVSSFAPKFRQCHWLKLLPGREDSEFR